MRLSLQAAEFKRGNCSLTANEARESTWGGIRLHIGIAYYIIR